MFTLSNVSKSYGKHRVLSGVNMSLHPGEIHGLIGVNGSGKSTLLHILSGHPMIHETGGFSGEIHFKTQKFVCTTPIHAIASGIGMVHQDFSLLPGLTVARNITLNREAVVPFTEKMLGYHLACIDREANGKRAEKALKAMGIHLEPETLTGVLSVSMKQFVEIAREICRDDLKLLMLDEPTAVLNGEEARQLMDSLISLARKGVAILYVSHRIDEIRSLCDRITVLRNGRVQACFQKDEKDLQSLSSLMLDHSTTGMGRNKEPIVSTPIPRPPRKSHVARDYRLPLISMKSFSVEKPGDALKGLDLEIFKGEIVGITGLSGHGKNALGPGIMGLHPTGGELFLKGDPLPISTPMQMIGKNIWMLPEERRTLGLFMDHTVMENICFAAMHNKGRFVKKIPIFPFAVPYLPFSLYFPLIRFPDTAACRKYAQQCVEKLNIQCTSVFQKTGELSGGNQQKVCLAAALAMEPEILFINEPTRGVDIRARESILTLLLQTRQSTGMTLVISSGELNELKGICDRIAVIYQGRLVDILTPDDSDEVFALAVSGLSRKNNVKNPELKSQGLVGKTASPVD